MKIGMQMNVRRPAIERVAIAKFVPNPMRQPEIEDVRIVGSCLGEVDPSSAVDFGFDIVAEQFESRPAGNDRLDDPLLTPLPLLVPCRMEQDHAA